MAMLTAAQGCWERGGVGIKVLDHVVDDLVVGLPCDDGEGFDGEFRDNTFYRETHIVIVLL